ncbi:LysR family transcriptional regulator [Vibrio paucivorans]
MNKLRQMSLFLNIVEAGSITKAADKLNLSKSVLSQHLKQLESDLSFTLLKRTTRRQTLTPAGEKFYQHCLKMHTIAERAWSEVLEQQEQPMGTLTITAPHALMNTIVIPALSSQLSQYQKLSFNLICEDHHLDLMQHDIDLAIRVGESPDSNYRQRKLGQFSDVLCQNVGSTVPLNQACYIANHWQGTHMQHQIKGENVEFHAVHRTNTIHQTIAMIEQGLGIGVVPDLMLTQHPSLQAIEAISNANIYALHPYSASVPIGVTLAQQAIEQQLIQHS